MKLQTALFLVTMLGMSLTLMQVEGNLGDEAIPANGVFLNDKPKFSMGRQSNGPIIRRSREKK
uniref:Uncharacterized protein n=1 Tax=Magallana gigas TaxID=29159 RepID=K1RM39_MAGGI